MNNKHSIARNNNPNVSIEHKKDILSESNNNLTINENANKTSKNNNVKLKKKDKNVFIYMESTYESKGPLSLLYRSIKENRRIKVWTRSHCYLRSICTGYLIAYDQYWNLAMIDVDEVFKVPNNECRSVSSILNREKNVKEIKNNADSELMEAIKDLKLHSNSNGFSTFQRHSNQLFIRGDNVVTIVLAD